MEKVVDFFSLKRPEYPQETRTLTDERLGIELPLTLKALDNPRQTKALELTNTLIAKYVGYKDEEDPADSIAPTEPFQPHSDGGDSIELTPTLLGRAAELFIMYQPPAKGALTVEQFIQMSTTSPEMWNQARIFCNELNNKAEEMRKKKSSEVTTTAISG